MIELARKQQPGWSGER